MGNGDVGFFALLLLRYICAAAGHVAGHFLGELAFFAPGEVDAWGCCCGEGVVLAAVEVGGGGHPEDVLGEAELPPHVTEDGGGLLGDLNLLVGVVELNGEV